jgi:superfamily II DNA or RNA helicase
MTLNNGFFGINKKNMTQEDVTQLLSDFHVVPYSENSKYKVKDFSIYTEIKSKDTTYCLVPRGYVMSKWNIPLKYDKTKYPDLSKKFDIDTIQTALGVKFFDYQHDCINALTDTSGILKLSCGAGKTFISIANALLVGKKFIIIVDKDYLCDQWKKEIDKLGLSVCIVSRLKKKKVFTEDVLISTFKTMTLHKYKPIDFNDYYTVIIDEVHMYLTPKYIQLFYTISRPYILGLTATDTKANKTGYLLNYFIGPVIYEYSKSYDGAPIKVVPIDFKSDCLKIIYKEGKIRTTETYKYISNLHDRNELLLSLIYKAVAVSQEKDQIIVIGLFREQLELMLKRLKDAPFTVGLYYSMATAEGRKQLDEAKKAKVILAIRALGGQSLNVPNARYMIMASSYITKSLGDGTYWSGSLEQLIGRIKRKKHTESPIIIDIFDNIGFMLRHKRLRLAFYKKEGIKMTEL